MVKYTRHWLKKIEKLYEMGGYAVRYEKGHFQSGHCVVEERKVIVVNKFFDIEARINTLLDLLTQVELDTSQLDEPSLSLLVKLGKWQGDLFAENEAS